MTEQASASVEAKAPAEARRRAAVAKIMQEYRDDAVVMDPLFGEPLVGKAAIATHKLAEMIAISDLELEVTERWTTGNQLFANWRFTGVHSGPYYNLAPTGNRIELSGSTVVTRENGLITQETLYYDAEHMRRQLAGERPERPDRQE